MTTSLTHHPTQAPTTADIAAITVGLEAVLASVAPAGGRVRTDLTAGGLCGLQSTEARLRLRTHGHNLPGPGSPTNGATVVRDGSQRTIATTELVPGDLMVIGPGDLLQADGRLFGGRVACDVSALNGDRTPQTRTAGARSQPGDPVQQPDLVFSGTVVISGTAIVQVLATGKRTLLGQSRKTAAHRRRLPTPATGHRRSDRVSA